MAFSFGRFLVAVLFLAGLGTAMPALAHAPDSLPVGVQDLVNMPLAKVGEGTYRKFGFSVYRATLWAPEGEWDPEDPYVLELHYLRGLSKDTMTDTVIDDLRDGKNVDDATFALWEEKIKDTLPAVEEGDVMIGVAIPGEKTALFMNGEKIAEIQDSRLSKAFFDIWLGPDADEDLRADLLKNGKSAPR